MDEVELVKKVIESFSDAIGVGYFEKHMFTNFITAEARNHRYEIQKSIIQIHDLIHEFEREHLRDY